jgi:zinc protease
MKIPQNRAPANCLAWVAGLSFLLAPNLARADQGLPAGVKKITTIEGITEYRLDNGLQVLLFPDESTPTVTVNLTVFVGSRHEGYGETGMAHLLEHMVFKGTPDHPDVPKALKEHGAQFNGTTWVDRTNYFETMRGTDDNLEFGIRLEADRMVHSNIKREDLASEMTVVRNEFEIGENSPSRVLSQRMMSVAYEWHNYGKSTIGNRSDIERVPIENLQRFYRKFYQPDNAMLVVAGNFKPEKAIEFTAKYFGAIKKPTRELENTYTEEPPQDGDRVVSLRRVGKVPLVGLMYHVPAGSHEDFAAVEMLTDILDTEPSGRLYKALVTTKKASNVGGSVFAWHDPSVLEVNIEVAPNVKVEEVRDIAINMLEKLGESDFTEKEVHRAQAHFKKNRDLLMTKSNEIGRQLSEWGAQGDWRLFFLHRDRVAKVTPADVKRVAGKYLRPSNRTLGLFIPTDKSERTPVPETPVVADLLKDYKSTQTIEPGEAFDPTPENIEKRVVRKTAADGPQLVVLPKKSRGGAVVATLNLRYGNEKSLKDFTVASSMLATLMTRGTEKYSRQDIQDELDLLGARLGGSGSAGDLTFTIETNGKNLAAVAALLEQVVRHPALTAEEFDILKREELDGLRKELTEPVSLARRSITRQLNPYPKDDVRYVPTIEEEIERLEATTAQSVSDLYKKQVGGQYAILSVVGDVTEAQVAKAFAFALTPDWKSSVPYERITRPAKTDVAGAKDVILTPDKASSVYISSHKIALTDTDPDYPAMEVANFLFGGGTLSSRLGNRVRQKEGLSYGVGSQFNASAKDKNASFMMFAMCKPENVEKVDKAITEELEKMLKEGPSSSEVDEAKRSYLEQRKVRRSTDSSLAFQLASGLENNRTFEFQAELEKKVAGLTTEDVANAFRKHILPKRLVTVEAGDFNKKKE